MVRAGHAYFPDGRLTGDIHMDDEEYWTSESYQGINLLSVFMHELGHSLGLRHSNVTDSIMAPKYTRYHPNMNLRKDDIKAITSLYGKKRKVMCASKLSYSWPWSSTCKIKRDDCSPRQAKNTKFHFLKGCGCQCCDTYGCGPKNYDE